MSKLLAALVIIASATAPLYAGEDIPAPPPEPQPLEMEVRGVVVDSASNTPIVILSTTDRMQLLPIAIGEAEATTIWRYLNNVQVPRPMTHDLLLQVIDKLGGKIDKVTITELKEGVFYAVIDILAGEKTIQIDARPSDSIALAVKSGVKLYVAGKVMDQAGRRSESKDKPPDPEPPAPDDQKVPADINDAI